ncbi:MAG: hypothetical protein ACR2N6_02100 [Miltoncostaeaceae bacterium]
MSHGLVHVLGEPGDGRDAIEEAVLSQGWMVSAGRPSEPIEASADVLVFDGRGAGDSAGVIAVDHRPLIAVLDGPGGVADQLRRRSAPTMAMAGFCPSGLQVGLSTCAALRPHDDREAQRLAAAS